MGFFDSWFKKKEDKQEVKKEAKKEAKVPASQQQQKSQPQQPAQQPQPELNEEDNWIYELILQYLISPIWKVTISEFLDEHCILFDDEEENKFIYYDIHKKFKAMMESLVDGMISELGVTEEQLSAVLEKGLKYQKHRKYFEQLLIIDNFLVFKKLMIKRNKENELEALREIQKQDQQQPVVPAHAQDIQRLELEKEKAELEHALAVSNAVEEERRRLLDDEEAQFLEALKQSEVEFRYHMMYILSQQQQQVEQGQQQVQQLVVEPPRDFQQQPQEDLIVVVSQIDEPLQPTQVKKKQPKLQPLPPQAQSKVLQQIQQPPPLPEKEELAVVQDRSLIQAQIEKIKQQQVEGQKLGDEQQESTEERKKRLQEQRELLRKKKQAQREQELEKYNEEQNAQVSQAEKKDQKPQTDVERRKQLLEQKKKQLLMNKLKEDTNFEQDL